MDTSLFAFFEPRGVAVIGASKSPEKLGHGVARNLIASGYTGAVHFVGQKEGELLGHPVYKALSDVPDPLDLAVIVVAAASAPAALRACASRGVHAAILASSGFREAGPEGLALEEECLQVARHSNIRLLGPNCIGTIDTHAPLDTSFLQPPMPPKGGIGLISHSGAFCAAIVDWSRHQGFGFSRIVSLGNQADVNETDMLPVLGNDAHTRVIALYMEGVSDGAGFVNTAREVSRRKPIVVLKVGRFESGQRAAASHTGAMAASDVAFEAAFAKAGIFRAASTEQMFDWTHALETCPLPHGRQAAILTDAGGPGVVATDALEMCGMRLASLSDSTRAELAVRLPPAASIRNPVDMLASASPSQYADCLRLLLEDSGVDSVMVILPPPPMYAADAVAEALIPVIRASRKPTVVALLGAQLTAGAFALFNRSHIPTYPFAERAASALSILSRRGESRQSGQGEHTLAIRPIAGSTRPGRSVADLVVAYGIPAVPLTLATSAQQAADLAVQSGFPVAMKIASPEISHKSDVGGVLLEVNDAAQAANGYAHLMREVKSRLANVRIDGVHIQRQILAGHDVIIGAMRDPNFGPLMMFGSGGIEVEGMKDVAFALAPLSEAEADDLIGATWAGRKLAGFRGRAGYDIAAVREALIRLSWLAIDHTDISEIEINPLRVLEHGVFALDIRVVHLHGAKSS